MYFLYILIIALCTTNAVFFGKAINSPSRKITVAASKTMMSLNIVIASITFIWMVYRLYKDYRRKYYENYLY